MKKRTKQVETMVERVNSMLKANRVRDEYHPDFSCLQWLLCEIGCYQGYNYFKDVEYKDVTGNVTTITILAGTADDAQLKEVDAYLQLY